MYSVSSGTNTCTVEVPKPTPYRPPLFNIDDEASVERSLQHLREEGFVVFENILSREELQVALSELWDFLEGLSTGINRNDPNTWGNDRWPPGVETGVVYTHAVGQSRFMWNLRSKERIAKIFSKIWNAPVSELLTSFDGCGLMRPTNFDANWKTAGGWYHVDQNGMKKRGDCCFQGLLNLIENMEEDPGIVLLPKSNLQFNSFFDIIACKKLESTGDFVKVPAEHLLGHYKESPIVKICVPAGAFVVWNSKTVHCNTSRLVPRPVIPAENTAEREAVTLERAVAYICMAPRSSVSGKLGELLATKKKAIRNGTTTTHWPNEFIEARQWKGEVLKPYVNITPQLTDHQKRLGGVI